MTEPKNNNRPAALANPCPEDDVLMQVFLHESSLEQTERIVDHVLKCPACRTKFKVLKKITERAKKTLAEVSEKKLTPKQQKDLRDLARRKLEEMERPRHRILRFPRFVYAAAALIFCAAVVSVLFIARSNGPAAYRGQEEAEFKLIDPQKNVDRKPEEFTWTSYPGADYYDFSLIDEDLNTVFHTAVQTTSLKLPEEVTNRLEQGKTYLWKVEVRDDDAYTIAQDSRSIRIR